MNQSPAVIGYPSGQDGAILPAWDYTCCIPQEKCSCKPNNNSFIDQAFSVKMAGYCFCFASLSTSTLSWSINTDERTWPISSHLDLTFGQ